MNCFQEKGILFLMILLCGAIHNSFAMDLVVLNNGTYEAEFQYFTINNREISLGKSRNYPFDSDNQSLQKLYTIENEILKKYDPYYFKLFGNQSAMKSIKDKEGLVNRELKKAQNKWYLSCCLWIFPVGIIAFAKLGFVDQYKKWVYCFEIASALACYKVCYDFFYQVMAKENTAVYLSDYYELLSNDEKDSKSVKRIEYLKEKLNY